MIYLAHLASLIDYAIGALLAGACWGHVPFPWTLLVVPLAVLSGFCRGMALRAKEKTT